DDGAVLDLGWGSDKVDGLLAVGAALFNRSDWTPADAALPEAAFWLLGREAFSKPLSRTRSNRPRLRSRAFAETGLYLLQSGHAGEDDRISVTFDCGPLGLGSIAAHGHADALSVTLRVGGHDLLVDPGTYDYFTERPYR